MWVVAGKVPETGVAGFGTCEAQAEGSMAASAYPLLVAAGKP